MKNLCSAIIDAARFLELSGDDVIDPDAAVVALEDMGATLQSATQAERQAFISACQSEATRLKMAGDSQAGEFVGGLPSAMGLSDEA